MPRQWKVDDNIRSELGSYALFAGNAMLVDPALQ